MFAGHDVQLLTAKTSVGSGHEAIDSLALALGAEGEGHRSVEFLLDGSRVNVSLVRRDRVMWLQLGVCFEDRASPFSDDPLIELRPETSTDREYKRQRLVREVQLGDPAFDRRVFIDNRCTDAEVKRLLSFAEPRAAVLRLLNAGIGPIGISSRQVSVNLRAGSVGGELDVEQVVLDLVTIARGGPPEATLKTVRGETLVASLLGIAVGLTCLFFFAVSTCHGVPMPFLGLGLATGALTAALSWWPMRRLVGGDSASGSRRALAVGLLALAAGLAPTTALTAINVGFDDSPAKRVTGHVSSITTSTGYKGRSASRSISVTWSDGSQSLRAFDEQVKVGTRCSEDRHEGALGQPWGENLRVERGAVW